MFSDFRFGDRKCRFRDVAIRVILRTHRCGQDPAGKERLDNVRVGGFLDVGDGMLLQLMFEEEEDIERKCCSGIVSLQDIGLTVSSE